MTDHATFKGRPATDLTREELIEAYTVLSHQFTEMRRCWVEINAVDDEIRSLQRTLASRRWLMIP